MGRQILLPVWCVAAITAAAVAAQAQIMTSHQIAYQGRLDHGGEAAGGSFDFWFELYPTPTGGDCWVTAPPHSECLWADEISGVNVVGGAFSVVLGTGANPLGDAIWQNGEVYLGIRVAGPSEGYTPLAGRQLILAVPMAARSETAKDYHVTGTLRVEGIATFDASVTAAGPVTVGAAGNALTINSDRIDAAGGTLYLQANAAGEVLVNGPLRWRCPGTMTPIGSWCIDKVMNSAATHAEATVACHGRAMSICSVDVLVACDQLNLTASACGAVTDTSGSRVWTSGIAYDSPYASSLFNEIAAYNGDNTIDRTDSGNDRGYFCCAPGYFY